MLHAPISSRPASLPARRGIRAIEPFSSRADAFSIHAVKALSPRAGAMARTDGQGRIRGYASVFGAMDLARDVVMPGAFRDSLARRGSRGVKLLWQHDPARPIGMWTGISEDRHGLYVEGKLDLELPRARELHALIDQGAVDGLSIGYRTEIDRQDPATGIRRLEKVDLWEVSIVTFPLLPQARIFALQG